MPAIVAACQDPLIGRFSPAVPSPYGDDDAQVWLASQEPARCDGRALALAVVAPRSGELLGAIALSSVNLPQRRSGLGYWLAPHARGSGFATEAVRLLAGWAFGQLGLARLELVTDPENVASQRVAERCGFVREGVMRSHMLMRNSGQRRDSVMYGLLPDEL